MTEDTTRASALSRRGFVGAGGLGVAGIALGSGTAAAARARALRVGVLTAGGLRHPHADRRFAAGLEAGFAAAGRQVRLTSGVVDQGYAGALAAVEPLLAGGARVVVAQVTPRVVEWLAPVCREAGAGLVVAGVGAHVVTRRTPGVVHCSLQHWQAAVTMGRWAAGRLGRSLFAIVARPDAGYDSVFALRRGFEAAGGSFTGQAMTHEAAGTQGVVAAAGAARASGASVVAVHASGERAVAIVRACRRAGVRARIVVDPMVVAQPETLRALGRAGERAHSASSLAGVGDPFRVLGHDVASLVAAASDRVERGVGGWAELDRTLRRARIGGLRGAMLVDADLATVSTPLAVEVLRRSDGRLRPVVVDRPGRVRGLGPLATLSTGMVGGYLNEYLTT